MLANMQTKLMNCILDKSNDALLSPSLQGPNALPPEIGINQYRINRKVTLQKVLESIYPICGQILGECCFKGVMDQYVQQYPVTHFNLDLYGTYFPEFLETMPFNQSIPYLPAVATLELAIHQVLLGSEANVLQTPYEVDEIWDAHQNTSIQSLSELIVAKKASYLLIWRKNATLQLQRLTERQYQQIIASLSV